MWTTATTRHSARRVDLRSPRRCLDAEHARYADGPPQHASRVGLYHASPRTACRARRARWLSRTTRCASSRRTPGAFPAGFSRRGRGVRRALRAGPGPTRTCAMPRNTRSRGFARAAVASEPSEEKASMTATTPALARRSRRARLHAPRRARRLAMRAETRIDRRGSGSDDLCALADALGADEADETEDDDERFDAVTRV